MTCVLLFVLYLFTSIDEGMKHKGCYLDRPHVPSQVFRGEVYNSYLYQTPALCLQHCAMQRKYEYFGLKVIISLFRM